MDEVLDSRESCLDTIFEGGWMAEGQTTCSVVGWTRHIPTEEKQNIGLATFEPKATASLG